MVIRAHPVWSASPSSDQLSLCNLVERYGKSHPVARVSLIFTRTEINKCWAYHRENTGMLHKSKPCLWEMQATLPSVPSSTNTSGQRRLTLYSDIGAAHWHCRRHYTKVILLDVHVCTCMWTLANCGVTWSLFVLPLKSTLHLHVHGVQDTCKEAGSHTALEHVREDKQPLERVC